MAWDKSVGQTVDMNVDEVLKTATELRILAELLGIRVGPIVVGDSQTALNWFDFIRP